MNPAAFTHVGVFARGLDESTAFSHDFVDLDPVPSPDFDISVRRLHR